MKHQGLVFLLLFSGSLLFGQEKKIDSLIENAKHLNGKEQARAYARICEKITRSNTSSVTLLNCANEALSILKKYPDNELLGRVYVSRAWYYSDISESKVAIENLLLALSYLQKTTDESDLGAAYNNLGGEYLVIKNYRLANLYFGKALAIKLKRGDFEKISSTYNNMAYLQLEQNNITEAIKQFMFALSYSQKAKTLNATATIYSNLASCYYETKNYSDAIKYAEESLKLVGEQVDPSAASMCYTILAKTYTAMDNIPKALGMAEKALALCRPINDKDGVEAAYEALKNAYYKSGDLKKAFEFSSKELRMKDSIYQAASAEEIALLQTKFEVAQKENEKQFLAQQNMIQRLELERKNYFILISAFVVLFILIVIFLLFRQNRLKTRRDAIALEQRLLRTQMNPHFIFNSLQAIQKFILRRDEKEAVSYLSSFGNLTRMILENSRFEVISLYKEVEFLKKYLELQKLPYGQKFDYKIEIESEMDLDDIAIPPMLAQPFIENAIEHGFDAIQSGGLIEVIIRKDDPNLVLEIKDNGRGLNTTENKKHLSLATTLTKERIGLMNKKSKSRASFTIEDRNSRGEHGVIVTFKLPLN